MLDQTDPSITDSNAPVQLGSLPRVAASRSPVPWRDLFVLFVGPAVILTAIFVLTEPSAFEYDITNPTLWGIYASNFAHRSWTHLGSNLVGYFFIAGIEYSLLTVAGYRKYFLGAFAVCLLVVPLFSHLFLQFFLIHQPVFHSYEAVGFSEPIAALTAFFPIALTLYYKSVSGFRWPLLAALLLYSGGVAFAISQLFGPSLNALAIGTLGIAGMVIVCIQLYRTRTDSPEQHREYIVTSFFALFAFYGMLYALFPGTNIGSMVSHLAGFLPGFFVPFALIWGFTNVRAER